MNHVYIGFDEKARVAARVTERSMRTHSSEPLMIHFIQDHDCRLFGYRRTYTVNEFGNKTDFRGEPFSNDFTFNRFMVPFIHWGRALTPAEVNDWVMVCDPDLLVLGNVAELFAQARSQPPEIQALVVKQEITPISDWKMSGQVQDNYPRKLWSSVMMLRATVAPVYLTLRDVNVLTKAQLLGFSWLPDAAIGELDWRWNVIPGHTERLGLEPKIVHFTHGVPGMSHSRPTNYDDAWRAVARELLCEDAIAHLGGGRHNA